MKFLVDSCVSFFAVKGLRENRFDVIWIPESGSDPGDEVIIKKAYKENRILVTADKDFGELVFLKKMEPPTIIRLVNVRAKVQGKFYYSLFSYIKKILKRVR